MWWRHHGGSGPCGLGSGIRGPPRGGLSLTPTGDSHSGVSGFGWSTGLGGGRSQSLSLRHFLQTRTVQTCLHLRPCPPHRRPHRSWMPMPPVRRKESLLNAAKSTTKEVWRHCSSKFQCVCTRSTTTSLDNPCRCTTQKPQAPLVYLHPKQCSTK